MLLQEICRLQNTGISNQQFFIFPNKLIKKLSKKYSFSTWAPLPEDKTAVRICTSWATKAEDVEELIKDIKKELGKGLRAVSKGT